MFGQVIEGMDTIRKIAKVPTDMSDKPRIPVHIFNCGEIDDGVEDDEVDSEEEAANNAFLMYERRRRELKAKKKEKSSALIRREDEA